MTAEPAPVVVGVDGSDASLRAVELGLHEAQLHRRPLRLVHAFEFPLHGVYLGPSPELPTGTEADKPPAGAAGLAADAERVVADALAHARAEAGALVREPAVEVDGEVVPGAVSRVLLAEATTAALLVLGDRGLGGFSGLLLGSVAVQVTAHAPVPVLVARGEPRQRGPVVVGVDGSTISEPATEFAFTEAELRAAPLTAVIAWSGRVTRQQEEKLPLIYDAEDIEAAQAQTLTAALRGHREQRPTLPVREQVRRGRPTHTLLAAAAEAQLLVVGARGRGGFTGLLLGSVSQAVLHHAPCPVAIVRSSG